MVDYIPESKRHRVKITQQGASREVLNKPNAEFKELIEEPGAFTEQDIKEIKQILDRYKIKV